MARYRIVRVASEAWMVQRKGLWWLSEATYGPGGFVAPRYFSSEEAAENYIDRCIADAQAATEPPREYPA